MSSTLRSCTRFPIQFFFIVLVTVSCNVRAQDNAVDRELVTPIAFKQKLLAAKRVVFLGDSNTNAGQYICQIEATLLKHYAAVPELINLGLSSETCCGLSEPSHPFPRPTIQERLARALEKTKPDLVFACYGMNDGIYHPFSEDRFEAFKIGIGQLITAHADANIPLILLTPPPFDPLPMRKAGKLAAHDAADFSWEKIYENYDSGVIKKYADWMKTIDAPNCLVIDTHQPINDYLANRRTKEPEFAFSNDGVHFDDTGHKVFANAILKGLRFQESADDSDQDLIKLVTQRQAISHAAWLTEVGHLRPGVPTGMPLEDATKKMAKISESIAKYLKSVE